MMPVLNLPPFSSRIRRAPSGKEEIFDPFRKKYVRLTREEWVRQHFLDYLVTHLGYPPALLVVEARLTFNGMNRRSDILVYNKAGNPCLVVECKAPSVPITQEVFDQVARYNMSLEVSYIAVTNGMAHYACRIDHASRSYEFLKQVPAFEQLSP